MSCTTFASLPDEEKEKCRTQHDEHLNRKDRCRGEKVNDKMKSMTDKSFAFDLQQVLQTPCGQVSTLYYKCKLSCCNLTVYGQASHEGTCCTWSEDMGKRGSSEIGSCLLKHNECRLPETVRHVSLFSDCCT